MFPKRTISTYDPSSNPVADDAPGWLAATERDDGTPISRNGPTELDAVRALLAALFPD